MDPEVELARHLDAAWRSGLAPTFSGARFDDDIVDKVLSSGHRADVAKLRRTDPPDNPEPPEPVEAPLPPLARPRRSSTSTVSSTSCSTS